jgi:hypothetical protein
MPSHEYPQLVAALSLIASLPSGDALVLLRRRIAWLVDQRAAIRVLVEAARDEGVPPPFLLDEDDRLAILNAELVALRRIRYARRRPSGA